MDMRVKGLFSSRDTVQFAAQDLPYVHEISLFDIDGDGDDDLIVYGGSFPGRSEKVARPAYVIWNEDKGYRIEQLPGHSAIHTSDYEFADFNGDGKTDLFITAHGYDDASAEGDRDFLYLQTNGSFTNATDRVAPVISFSHGAGHGDVDGDGDIDIVVNAQYGNTKANPYLLINDGTGTFSLASGRMPASSIGKEDFSHERYHWVALVDVNGDGLADLVTGRERENFNSTSSKLFINAGGAFSDSRKTDLPGHPDLGMNFSPTEIIGADIDGDGDNDLIMLGHTTEPYGGNWAIQILSNNGSGQFTDVTRNAISGAVSGNSIWMSNLGYRDVNGDGLSDLVVESYQGGQVPLDTPVAWLGDGTGHFTPVLASDIVPADQQFLVGISSLIYDKGTIRFLSVTAGDNKIDITELTSDSLPQLDFGARARGDTYIAVKGAEQIDGGGGLDTFRILEARASATISRSGTDLAVTNGGSVDSLSNIERIAFTDGTLAFDLDGAAGQTYRLYQAAFARTPDTAGLGHNVKLVDGGMSLHQMSSAFIGSAEFIQRYGASTTDTVYINALYNNVLGRDADAGGLAGWLDRLSTGEWDRPGVLIGFSESAENKTLVGTAIENGIWLG